MKRRKEDLAVQKTINPNDTIYTITNEHPKTIDVLVEFGFDKLKNPMIRNTIGKTMTLQTICDMRKVNLQEILAQMNRVINQNLENCITVKGVLPCPIRIPLVESIDQFIEKNNLNINYTLPPASTGLDWLISETDDVNKLADIYLSAGFGLFFDKEKIGKYAQDGVFRSNPFKYNETFKSFADENNIYTILGVVPAVFMVNKKLLADRPCPRKWTDLLKDIYKGELAIPMKDLDLFNALLLGIYTSYGESAVAKLGEAVVKNMHPAEMVKNSTTNATPLISVAPYFFASMVKESDDVIVVWPEDGAIASPIFLISKTETYDSYKPFLDFLTSKEIGTILSSNGRFPSTLMGIDNGLSPDKKFIFSGFDFINKNDIAKLLTHLENVFFGRK